MSKPRSDDERRARALWAARQMHETSKRLGNDKMTLEEINAEIEAARQERREREERQCRERGQ